MDALISISRPDPVNPDLFVIQDNRNCTAKIRHKILSILRELGYLFTSLHRSCFPGAYEYDRPDRWNSESEGLCVLIHGLNASPQSWNLHLDQLRYHPNIDTFVPFVEKAGNCSLEEAATPILSVILDYTQNNQGKHVCLFGTSNGSRICTYLETRMREEAPTTPVKVSTIAGIHFGSSMMNHLNWLGLGRCYVKPILREELPYGNETAKALLARVREPLADGVAKRVYEFYASPEDLFVPDLDSSLPALGKGETYRIIPGQGHCSLPDAVAEEQTTSCINFIYNSPI